ncbi:DNA-processing protein DprA [Tumebacillus sp. DT12]|uniref:DNA-processing protein DprA n=1 Tax=Tumebacillus lacus TaxID=2995335 RepID=A0ABT3WUZ9_9BACL|nr:DNA-processing protein DprA [Tumebacillus lacus]MCX7568503.1 DNA-processing protein DprA [Tumebacillus lacus]
MRDADVLLWLSWTPGVGGRTVQRLQECFTDWREVWEADHGALRAAGVRPQIVKELCRSRTDFDPAEVRSRLQGEGIRYFSMADREYPASLRHLFDPPAGLFGRGEWPATGERALAVVGPRTPTVYGRTVAKKWVGELAERGLTIVSGLARGIDTVAHEAAVTAGGQTVAVLGSGLLRLYPPENARLAERIASGHGLVVSEYHPLTPGKPGHFPVRNRLIAGLSQGVWVVEAGERSGSLITADLALEQGCDVYALPGPVTSPQSVGTNRLLQQGAKLAASPNDIWEDYAGAIPSVFPASSQGQILPVPPLSSAEERLLDAMGWEAVHLDLIAARTGFSPGPLYAELMKLQLRGVIAAVPGGRFARIDSTR